MKRFVVTSLTAICGLLLTTTAHASFAEKHFQENPEWKTQEEVDAETERRLDARTTTHADEQEEPLRFQPVETQEEEKLNLPQASAITRSEFTALLVRSLYSDVEINNCYWDITSVWPPRFELLFRDVSVDHPYAPEICIAMRDGLVRGYGNDIFKPDAQITFADGAKILSRAHGLTPWADPSKPKHWFDPYVQALARRKAIPLSIENLDQRLKVADAEEMVRRLGSGDTSLASRSADEMITAWEKKYEQPKRARVVTTSSTTVQSSSSKTSAPISSLKPKSSSPAIEGSAASRPKAWYEF